MLLYRICVYVYVLIIPLALMGGNSANTNTSGGELNLQLTKERLAQGMNTCFVESRKRVMRVLYQRLPITRINSRMVSKKGARVWLGFG